MCEFTVYLTGESPEEREQIAKGIVVVKVKDEKIALLTMMGESVSVESAYIREVNTMTAELTLQKK